MPEPDDVMNGPFWPSDWKTGWFGVKYADLEGFAKTGHLEVSLVAARNVSEGTGTTVIGTPIIVQLVDGKPYHPLMQINDNGDWVMEFPTTNDPDIEPITNLVQVVEKFDDGGGSTLQFTLPGTATFNSPKWPATDLETVITQSGVRIGRVLWVDHFADGIPSIAVPGDTIIFMDTDPQTIYVIEQE